MRRTSIRPSDTTAFVSRWHRSQEVDDAVDGAVDEALARPDEQLHFASLSGMDVLGASSLFYLATVERLAYLPNRDVICADEARETIDATIDVGWYCIRDFCATIRERSTSYPDRWLAGPVLSSRRSGRSRHGNFSPRGPHWG